MGEFDSPSVQAELEAQTPRRFQFQEVASADLRPGDKIDGVENLNDLDAFVDALSLKLFYKPFSGRRLIDQAGRRVSHGFRINLLSDLFRQQASRHGFHGTMKDFDITILPLNPAELHEESGKKAVSFHTSATMYSTGRGEIGKIQRISTLYSGKRGKESSLRSRAIDSKTLRREIENVQQQSVLSARATYLQAISNVVSGGLPTLGKDR